MPDAVVFHYPCQDGLSAAWVARSSFAPDAELVPFSHGDQVPCLSDFDTVWVFDVGFSPEVLLSWAESCRRVLVFDHHVSFLDAMVAGAPHLLSPLGRGLTRADDPDFSGVSVSISMERSGAGLAALVASACGFADVVPSFVWDVEDRDLWRWSIAGSAEVCEAIDAAVRERDPHQALTALSRLALIPREHLVHAGRLRLDELGTRVSELAGSSVEVNVAGFTVPFVLMPDPKGGSDVAHELLRRFPNAPFAAFGVKVSGGGLKVGLRSEDAREDVAAVAAMFGGGGHRNAAGLLCRDVRALAR